MDVRCSVTIILLPLLLFGISGCGQVVAVRHTMLPPGAALGSLEPKEASVVSLFKEGSRPSEGCIGLARLSAKGDPYTKREVLEGRLKEEGTKLGADFVLITGYREIEDNGPPHFIEYGAGIPIADDVRNPYLYGLACRQSNVRLGIDLSKDWTVQSVAVGSLAAKMGIEPGDRLVSVNRNHLPDHQYAYEQDILSRRPGDRVVIEYLTKTGNRVSKDIALE